MDGIGLILYARCEVWYKGRAESYLAPGDYLIIRKKDGTLLIHGATLTTPLNYQPPGAELEYKRTPEGIILTSTRKKEVIKIKIQEVYTHLSADSWSNNKITLWGTEGHLREYVIKNIDKYFPGHIDVSVEYNTPVGAVDLLVIQDKPPERVYNVIELKRKKATLAACSQLGRYLQYFRTTMRVITIGYIFSPSITTNALTHLQYNGSHHVKVDLPQMTDFTGAIAGEIAGPGP